MTDTFDFTTRSGNATTTFKIRVVPLEGNPWFVAVDLYSAIGLSAWGGVLNPLGADEKTLRGRTSLGLKAGRDMWLISESGLYKLIMRSDKPQARAFQDWVTKEVLPTIRKTGGYVLQGADRAAVGEGTVGEMPDVAGVMAALKDMEERFKAELAAQLAASEERARKATREMLDKVLKSLSKKADPEEVKVRWTAAEINQLGIPPRDLSNPEVGIALTQFCKQQGFAVGAKKNAFGGRTNLYSIAAAKALWGR